MKKKLRRLKKHLKLSKKQTILLGVLFLFCVLFYIFILKDLPAPTKLSSGSYPQSSQIFDRNGKLLYTIYSDRNQTFTPITQIPKIMQQATISVEDKDFYKHGAIDIRGIARALYSTIFHRQLQGGSTITQQLVKNSLLSSERTITRKIKEVILSFVTELLYPKDKILEMYLNQIPYGGTSYGVEAASMTYFGKHVGSLDLAEAALLAGLPEAPSTFSPFGTHPELGKQRQEDILNKMFEQKFISKEQRDQAKNEQLHFQPFSNAIQAPHFSLYVKDLLVEKYGERLVEEGGLRVKTSLDLDLQNYAQASVGAEVEKVKNYHVGNGAAVVTNPATGEILAMVGSTDYFEPKYGNVNMTIASLQPGSSIKPINYAAGLIKGYTAATPFVDQPICFPGTPPYCPHNYDGNYHGVVQMRFALGNSFNIPAVKMLKLNGVDAMIATASAMGISTFTDPSRYGLSLTLGGGEVTMLDMAEAFGVFANQGYRRELHPILQVTDSQGKILEEYKPNPSPIFGKKVLPAGVTYIISHILLDNGARTEAFGPNSELRIGNEPVSVKTGTTNDYRDNWTDGYTKDYVVIVWVGNNDHTAMSGIVSGVTGAAPIWHDIMSHLVKEKPATWPTKPSTVIGMLVCSTSGLLPPPDGTPDKCVPRFEYFIKGTEPKTIDPGKQQVLIDKSTNNLAKPGQTDNVEERNEVIVTDPTGDRYCVTCPPLNPPPPPPQ